MQAQRGSKSIELMALAPSATRWTMVIDYRRKISSAEREARHAKTSEKAFAEISQDDADRKAKTERLRQERIIKSSAVK